MPGFKFGKREDFIGLKGVPVGEVVLNHVIVPESHLLGVVGQGLEIGDNAHADARILMGAVLAGIMDHELATAVSYSKERKAMDTPLTNFKSPRRKSPISPSPEKIPGHYIKKAPQIKWPTNRMMKSPQWPSHMGAGRLFYLETKRFRFWAVMATVTNTRLNTSSEMPEPWSSLKELLKK